jgi:putative oxidoreductase
MRRLFSTNAPAATVLVRLLTGSVFLSEGIQKFLYPTELAAGRFAKIGIPAPQIMGPFVGGCEIVCGALLIIGLLTRLAAIVLLIDISIAIVSTKIPVLLGHGFWGFSLMKLPRYGFWSMMHEARTDFSMWLGLLFLLIVGAGKKLSFDATVVPGNSTWLTSAPTAPAVVAAAKLQGPPAAFSLGQQAVRGNASIARRRHVGLPRQYRRNRQYPARYLDPIMRRTYDPE